MNLTVLPQQKKNEIKFTNDQKVAIDGIIDFIAKPFQEENYIIGLNGAGGTGKTFITNFIIENCIYTPSLIACTSPTHKACRVLSSSLKGKTVNTIQSVFGFRLDLNLEDFDPNMPQFNPKASPKLDGIKLLVIDEASMLPAKLVTYICKKCKELNIKILFIGDSSQLAPVNEAKSIAFARCSKVFTLKEIVRQAAGNPIAGLLELLRYDIEHRTNRFLTYIATHAGTLQYNDKGEGFTILNRREFIENVDRCFSTEEYTKNIDMYRVIAYTNTAVASWNNYIRNNIIKDSEKGIITKHDLIMCYETIVDEFLSVILHNSEEYIINDIINFVDPKFGFKGYLIKFQLIHGGTITDPIFVINHMDMYTIQMYNKVVTDLISDAKRATGATRINKWKIYYDFKRKYLLATNIIDRTGKILFERDIDYGFAITSHKSQGSTYDTVFVDGNDMIFDKNGMCYGDFDNLYRRLYVACSRAKKSLFICYGA